MDPKEAAAHLFDQLEPSPVPLGPVELSEDARILLGFVGESDDVAAGATSAAGVGAVMAHVYGRPWPEGDSVDGTPSTEALDVWLRAVGADIATQAILTTEAGDLEHVTFAAVHWPSPLAPRLRVVRIPEEIRGEANRHEVMDLLGTCAVEVEEWVAAPEDVALRFLDEHVHAAMFVSGRDRETGEGIEFWIEPENLVAALRFEDPRTARLDSYSAWFAGEAPGPVAMARLLPRLRASLGPRDLWDLYRSLQ